MFICSTYLSVESDELAKTKDLIECDQMGNKHNCEPKLVQIE